jgi:LAGLIDADG endonuclease
MQLPVLVKIKEFLENNLGFDLYSINKWNSTSAIAISTHKGKNNSKSTASFIIKNIRILNNYLIPFLNNLEFRTKKSKDFIDFKIISEAIYNGAHKNNEIKYLILKLSYTMNNYRLSIQV